MIRYEKNIYIEMSYPATPVVFLHAFPVNHQMWQPQFDFLRQNGIGYITLDYPGFGKSTLTEKKMNISDYGDKVWGLLQQLRVRKAVIAGLSMGGYVAFALYRKHPELFAGLLLANTRATADTEEGRQNRYAIIDSLKKTLDLTPLIQSHLTRFLTDSTRENNPQLVAQVENLMDEGTAAGVIQALQAMAERPDSTGLLSQMDFPVSIIAGEKDTITSVEEAGAMAALCPAAILNIIPDAAHLSNMEKPQEFNNVLWQLLQQVHKQQN